MLFARLTTRRIAHHLVPRHAREEAAKYNDQSSLEEALTVSRSEFSLGPSFSDCSTSCCCCCWRSGCCFRCCVLSVDEGGAVAEEMENGKWKTEKGGKIKIQIYKNNRNFRSRYPTLFPKKQRHTAAAPPALQRQQQEKSLQPANTRDLTNTCNRATPQAATPCSKFKIFPFFALYISVVRCWRSLKWQ